MDSLENFITQRSGNDIYLETLTVSNMSDDYVRWLQDREIIRFLELRHEQQTSESVSDFVNNCFSSKNDLLMGIFLQDEKKHIGNIKLGPVVWRYLRADIGIVIGDKNYWGRGLATEAIRLLCDIAFYDLGLRRVQAGAYGENMGSVKAFEKAGFRVEGVLRDYWLAGEKPMDNVVLGKLSTEHG